MKLTVYLRVAEGPRGPRVAASSTPNYVPLMTGSPGYSERSRPLPTAMFALSLDVPDEVLQHAEQVLAEIEVPADKAEVAAEVA